MDPQEALRMRGFGGTKKFVGDAEPADVRSGKTFTNAFGNNKIGSLPIQSAVAQTVTPTTSNIIKAAGIYDGDITIQGDPDLVASNILSGKNIFGVVGNVATYGNVTAGSNLLLNHSTVGNITSTDTAVYGKKLKEIRVNLNGTIRVAFTMQQNTAVGNAVVAKIYVNGVARGIERGASNGSDANPITYTEDITINSGDLVQIFGYTKSASWTATLYDMKISLAQASPFATINL